MINIITRKDFEGVEINARFGDTKDGGYGTQRVILTAGASNDTTNVFFSAEYYHNSQLLAPQRDYAASDVANERGAYSVGGATFLDPVFTGLTAYDKCGDPNDPLGSQLINTGVPGDWCRYNRSQWRQLFPENERLSIFTKLTHDFNDNLQGFARFGFAEYTTDTQIEPNFYGGWWFGSQPQNNDATIVPSNAGVLISGIPIGGPGDELLWGLVPADGANNPIGIDGWFVRRLFEYGPRVSHIENTGVNRIVGLNGIFGKNGMLEWETAISYNRTRLTITRPNIISSVFNNEVTAGLDLFKIIPQDVIDRTTFLATRQSESKNWTADFQVSGELPWELPGGPVAFASIIDFEQQSFFNQPDPISIIGDAFDGSSAGGGKRNHWGVGLEVLFPIHDTFEVTLAGRFDDYQDDSNTGSAFSPLINFTWRPTNTLLIRGSWGESFRAPDLQRLFGATTSAFTTVNNPFTGLQEQSIPLRLGANIDLAEEEGEHYGFGIVWDAFEGFTASADFYNISLEQIVSTPSAQFILNSCFAAGIFCENFDLNPIDSTIIELRSGAINVSLQEIQGIDFTFNYDLITERAGFWNFNLQWAWVDSIKTQFSELSDPVENIGFATLPENRLNFLINWTKGDFGATWLTIWVDEMCGVNGFDCGKDEFIDSYTVSNASVRYDFGDWGLVQLGVNNVFNEDPADDPTNNQWPWFFNNGGYSNPIGLEYYLQYRKTWGN